MDGRTRPFIRALEEQMQEASEEWDFERAAKLRDDIAALTTVLEKNSIVLNNGVDADIFALAYDELNVQCTFFTSEVVVFEEHERWCLTVSMTPMNTH